MTFALSVSSSVRQRGRGFFEDEMTKDKMNILFDLCAEAQSWPLSWPDVTLECYDDYLYSANYLVTCRNEFNNGDPLALFEAITGSYQRDFSLPLWAHSRLSSASSSYLSTEGNQTIDSLLNLQKGKGPNNTPFKRREKKGMNNEIVFHVCTLNEYLDFSLPVTYLILSKIKIEYANGIKTYSTILAPSTIGDIYDDAEHKYSRDELNDCFGSAIEDRLDCFITNYADTFSRLKEGGILQGSDISSALRSFHALF
jgi:hypothetical protein